MKVGQKLTAINVLDPKGLRLPFLTIGKEYSVGFLLSTGFYIEDDRNKTVFFSNTEYETYFQSITPESLDELGFEKEQQASSYWRGNNSFIISIRRSKIRLNGVEMPNCRTLTDLKDLIRILGV
jgi:hypothetical protein